MAHHGSRILKLKLRRRVLSLRMWPEDVKIEWAHLVRMFLLEIIVALLGDY